MICSACEHKRFAEYRGRPNRYYCGLPQEGEEFRKTGGPVHRVICLTARGSKELTIKTSPRWCPLRNKKGAGV